MPVVDLIKFLDKIFFKNRLRLSITENCISFNAQDLIRDLLRQIDLVQRDNDRDLLFFRHIFQNSKQLQLITDIQKRSGFIQDQYLRFLADRSCQKDPLSLPVTDRLKTFFCVFCCMDNFQCFLCLFLIFSR